MGVRLLETDGVGARIDRYDLVAELASGGMATVYLARLSAVGGFQRSFAIKRLHPHLAGNSDFVQMFFDEARLAALIRHPNVVPILEVGEGADGYYLVMEYIEGDTFASLLSKTSSRGQRMPNAVVLRIVIEMLHGLHAAHELKDDHGHLVGLVHRDVSPQNVMVGTDGITRITDFGVARAASALSETRAGQLKGKLAYMAPEQASGRQDVDRRVDVFAAGVVLWEALAFRRLFKAANEAMTLSRVLTEPIVSPEQFSPGVPPGVAAVCLKALERDLSRRYVSAVEFATALERAALAAGQLASVKEVADYVEEIVGTDVESHRVAIRRWMERRERLGHSSQPGSLRPGDLASVTMASVPVPPASARAATSSFPGSAPASTTHSGVIVTPAARRRKALWVAAPLALLGAGAVAWAMSGEVSTLEGVAPVAKPSGAPSTVAVVAPPEAPATAASAPTSDLVNTSEVVSAGDLPEAEAEVSDTETEVEAVEPTRGTKRPSPRRRVRSSKKSLPDLDNPYQ